jgi:histone acetyltransferase
MLKKEVYSQESPTWDQDFLSALARTSQLGRQLAVHLLWQGQFHSNANLFSCEQLNGGTPVLSAKAFSGLETNPGEKRKINDCHILEEADTPSYGDYSNGIDQRGMTTITDPETKRRQEASFLSAHLAREEAARLEVCRSGVEYHLVGISLNQKPNKNFK